MNVRQAKVCLDCDEIYNEQRKYCPQCYSGLSVKLRKYFPALDLLDKEKISKMRLEKKNEM